MNSEPRVFVVIPAYCESKHIQRTICGVPASVAGIVVVDDASPDGTAQAVRELNDRRTHLLQHKSNRGVGAAIYSGYQKALEEGADILVVMAGDNQMDGNDLPALLRPLIEDKADYVKGDRLAHPLAAHMPRLRRWGSSLLATVTSWACGLKLHDSQCGYTALSRNAALHLDFSQLWQRYGYPNELLISLARRGFRIAEVPVRPVYADEQSGLRPYHLLSIMSLVLRRWWKESRRSRLLATSYSNAEAHSNTEAHSKEQVIG